MLQMPEMVLLPLFYINYVQVPLLESYHVVSKKTRIGLRAARSEGWPGTYVGLTVWN